MPLHVIRSLNPIVNTDRENKVKAGQEQQRSKPPKEIAEYGLSDSAKDKAIASMVLDKLFHLNRYK